MPFTPLHLGPGLLVALVLYPLLDLPTLLLATIILDIEPLLVLLLNLPQPLHGPYHSLTVSTMPALAIAIVMYFARRYTEPYMERIRLPQKTHAKHYVAGALVGVWLHVLMDAVLYPEMTLIYPFQWNPLLGLISPDLMIRFSLISFPLAIIVYLLTVTLMKLVQGKKTSIDSIYVPQPDPVEQEIEEPMPFFMDLEPEPEDNTEPVTEQELEAPLFFMTDPEPEQYNDEDLPVEEMLIDDTPLIMENSVKPIIFIGSDKLPEQWGIIGKTEGQLVAVDLNEPHIVFLCGKQGSGKGYSIGVITEMLLSRSIPRISQVKKPATIIVFHKPREDMRSEFWSIIEENKNKSENDLLREFYGVEPRKVITEKNFRIFVDPFVYQNEQAKFEKDYGTRVHPIGINPTRLTAEDWPHVLSLGKKSGSMYVKKIFQIIKKTQYEPNFGLRSIRRHVEGSDLNPNQKGFALMRLETLEDYLEGGDFTGNLKMGGVNIFDLRKIMMEPDDIFSVMILVISSLINNPRTVNEQFVFVINEAHDYLRKGLSKDFTDYVNYLIRKKRHAGTWLMLDTHFPEDVDPKVIKGSDIKIFHKSDIISSTLLKQIVDGTPVPPHQLNTGEAIVRADKSNQGPDKLMIVNVRPRLTHHGGATKTAI
ncbi:MAG: hypothetical protein NWE89_16125 [Candidatus Bathyarchaeota archaeon]|nr:hypothetical protein [Candidatus Bathyarchaeota archaeon]